MTDDGPTPERVRELLVQRLGVLDMQVRRLSRRDRARIDEEYEQRRAELGLLPE